MTSIQTSSGVTLGGPGRRGSDESDAEGREWVTMTETRRERERGRKGVSVSCKQPPWKKKEKKSETQGHPFILRGVTWGRMLSRTSHCHCVTLFELLCYKVSSQSERRQNERPIDGKKRCFYDTDLCKDSQQEKSLQSLNKIEKLDNILFLRKQQKHPQQDYTVLPWQH